MTEKMLRGEKTKFVLSALHEGVACTLDVLEWYLSLYAESYRKSWNSMAGREHRAEKRVLAELYRERQRFYTLLNRLKRAGLVASRAKSGSTWWSLTAVGKKKLSILSEERFPYEKEVSQIVTVVAFDIPESKRRDRDWVRDVLRFLDFEMLQRSIWIGKVKVPEGFLRDLRKREILDCVEIFEIGERGTLSRLN